MIKTSELRIGNLFDYEATTHVIDGIKYERDTDEHVITSKWINGNGKEFYAHFIDSMKPIPLTEEWLVKLGKSPVNVNGVVIFDRFRLIWKEAYKYWYVVDNESLAYLSKIVFVHEWQNFVFVMNGKELEIN